MKYKKKDDNENDKEGKNEFKKLIRNISSISKETTMNKTKKRFYSSINLDKNKLYTNISFKENKNKRKNKRMFQTFLKIKFAAIIKYILMKFQTRL